jgi:fumarate hydratase subunit alpha/L(+)-tartrate dehydratase alpha subunit
VNDTVTLQNRLFGIRDATAFAVHVELAATHITMNPVAVNMQCHSARRASALFTETGIAYGY